MGDCRRADELDDFVAVETAIEVFEQPLAGPQQDRNDGDVQLIDEAGLQVLLDRCTPRPRASHPAPSAAADACSRAASIPSVTKWKVVPPPW